LPFQIVPGSIESLGTTVLKSRGLFSDAKWYWIGLGALVGYIFLFNGLYTAAYAYFKCEFTFFISTACYEELFMIKHILR